MYRILYITHGRYLGDKYEAKERAQWYIDFIVGCSEYYQSDFEIVEIINV